MSRFWSGFIVAVMMLLACSACWESGKTAGMNDVISTCSYYRKYAVDGTQFLLCSGIVKPDDMLPSVDETNAKFYSKENKEKHKKDRK